MDWEDVKSKEDLINYIVFINNDFKDHSDEWENDNIEMYLECAMACIVSNLDRDTDLYVLVSNLTCEEFKFITVLFLVASHKNSHGFIEQDVANTQFPETSIKRMSFLYTCFFDGKWVDYSDIGIKCEDSMDDLFNKLIMLLKSNAICQDHFCPSRLTLYTWNMCAAILHLGRYYE